MIIMRPFYSVKLFSRHWGGGGVGYDLRMTGWGKNGMNGREGGLPCFQFRCFKAYRRVEFDERRVNDMF